MNVFRRLQVIGSIALALGLYPALCFGDEKDKAPAGAERHTAFLGVAIDEVHPAIASHLPDIESDEQGVLVREVSEDSPAARSGIKKHDILKTYDDQKLFSPEQLLKLVRSDKPGREVTLGLIRKGKTETVKVKLGEHTITAAQQKLEDSAPRSLASWLRTWGQRGMPGSEAGRPNWNSFDSMTLKKLDKDRFHASIKHTDKQGKMQTHEFEGTRGEIHKKIEADSDLTPEERTHLLRSLGLEGPSIPFRFFLEEPEFDF
jgi:serine protease Do